MVKFWDIYVPLCRTKKHANIKNTFTSHIPMDLGKQTKNNLTCIAK